MVELEIYYSREDWLCQNPVREYFENESQAEDFIENQEYVFDYSINK